MADISKVQKLTGCLADLGRMSQLRSTAVLTLLHRAQLGTVCLTWPIHNSESSQLRSRTSVGIQYVIHLQYSNDEKWRCALIAMCCSEDGFHSQTSRCSFECSWIIGAMRRPSVILWPGKNQPLEDARPGRDPGLGGAERQGHQVRPAPAGGSVARTPHRQRER